MTQNRKPFADLNPFPKCLKNLLLGLTKKMYKQMGWGFIIALLGSLFFLLHYTHIQRPFMYRLMALWDLVNNPLFSNLDTYDVINIFKLHLFPNS